MVMIKAASLSLDTTSNIIILPVINTKPFPISYKPTGRFLPNLQQLTNYSVHLVTHFCIKVLNVVAIPPAKTISLKHPIEASTTKVEEYLPVIVVNPTSAYFTDFK